MAAAVLTGCAAERAEPVGAAGAALEISDAARFREDCAKRGGVLGGGDKTCTFDVGADRELDGKSCAELGGRAKGDQIDQHGAARFVCVISYEDSANAGDATVDGPDIATK